MSNLALANARSYWLPFFIFALFTTIEGYLPVRLYPWAYTLKMVTITTVLLLNRRALLAIKPSWSGLKRALVVGIVVFVQWIVLDRVIPYPHIGSRTAFNPIELFSDNRTLAVFLAIRLFGLIALVPVIEELFWRGFALRYFTDEDFESVPVGVFSTSAFWIVTLGSAATHPEWLVALIAFTLYAWLLKSTRSLFPVIVAHATSNAALGAYILVTHDWQYW